MSLQNKMVPMLRKASVFSAEDTQNAFDNAWLGMHPDWLFASPDGGGSGSGEGALSGDQGDEVRDESDLGPGIGSMTDAGTMGNNAGNNDAAPNITNEAASTMGSGDDYDTGDADDHVQAALIIPADPDALIVVDATGNNKPDVIVTDVDGDGVLDVIVTNPMDSDMGESASDDSSNASENQQSGTGSIDTEGSNPANANEDAAVIDAGVAGSDMDAGTAATDLSNPDSDAHAS